MLTKRSRPSPAEGFTHSRSKVRKAIFICERRHARSADDGIELHLAFLLFFGVDNHRQHEPGHHGGSLGVVRSIGQGWGGLYSQFQNLRR